MKKNHRLKRIVAVSLGLFALQSTVVAQAFKLDIDKPKVEELPSPDPGGNTGNKSFKPKDWMEVELKIRLQIDPKFKDKVKFAERVSVRWYLAAKNPEGGRQMVLLEKEVNYVNVPIGEDVYVSVYLSPNSVKALTGKDSVSKSMLENIGGEIKVNGSEPVQKSGFFALKSKPLWWNSASLARYDKIPLRNKNETPFKFLWYDRYAEIEVKR